MRKREKNTFQWPDFKTSLRFSFRALEVPILRVRKRHFHCFSSLQKRHFRCQTRKSETCIDFRCVTCYRGKQSAHFRPLESGFLAFSHFMYLRKFKFRKRGSTFWRICRKIFLVSKFLCFFSFIFFYNFTACSARIFSVWSAPNFFVYFKWWTFIPSFYLFFLSFAADMFRKRAL